MDNFPRYSHKDGSTIIGMDDGGIHFVFKDHPVHHRTEGMIEVSFSAKTLKRMHKLAKKAMRS